MTTERQVPASRSLTWLELLAYLVLNAIALGLIANFEAEKTHSLDRARLDQREKLYQEGRQVSARLERYFDQIYRGLRTLARLPSVRSIDRHATNFRPLARASAQEIYNNLAETVKVSEFYILPLDFDPDAIDPATGKLQEPIAAFDELIVGQSADGNNHDKSAGRMAGPVLEEIEIFEYRLMQQQIAALKSKYLEETAFANLAYPAILGAEVITCDNSQYSSANPNDEDRKGLVFSIPFYGTDGRMRGIVSAIVLTSTIRQQLPPGQYAIANARYDLKISHPISAHAEAARAWDPKLTNVFELALRDVNGGWQVTNSMSEVSYQNSADVVAARDKAYYRQLAILIAFAALISIVRLSAQRQREMQNRNALLELKVTERTDALEQARRDAESANLAKTRFLTHMSHEIRTPMSAVIGAADLLIQADGHGPGGRHLTTIRNSGQALLQLINQVLDLSAVEAGRVTIQPAPNRIRPLVYEVVDLFEPQAHDKSLVLGAIITDSVPDAVWLDGGRIRQVLVNLIGNAIKATDSGSIVVQVDIVDGRGSETAQLRFEVSDSGCGVPSSLAPQIFKLNAPIARPTSTVQGGAGLGLAISRSLVEKMGGEIGHFNRPGKGATFYFTHPLRTATIDEPARMATSATVATLRPTTTGALAGINILLVEDNPTLTDLAREILQKAGCTVTAETDGQAALSVLERAEFDMTFMDCRLQNLDGIEATRLIRTRERLLGKSPMPIVALTANAFEWDRDACLEAGMNDFLGKPYTAAQLIDAVLRNRRPVAETPRRHATPAT